ncbi:MAG: hypothetical protein NC403_08425 [Muribaculaceae bacterium]|nr:hypothetical protein [Muribaculaceae bacterium]
MNKLTYNRLITMAMSLNKQAGSLQGMCELADVDKASAADLKQAVASIEQAIDYINSVVMAECAARNKKA